MVRATSSEKATAEIHEAANTCSALCFCPGGRRCGGLEPHRGSRVYVYLYMYMHMRVSIVDHWQYIPAPTPLMT